MKGKDVYSLVFGSECCQRAYQYGLDARVGMVSVDERDEAQRTAGQYSAMLADICEALFGDSANGKPFGDNVPRVLSLVHCHRVCGVSMPASPTYLDVSYEMQGNQEDTSDWLRFLKALNSIANNGMVSVDAACERAEQTCHRLGVSDGTTWAIIAAIQGADDAEG